MRHWKEPKEKPWYSFIVGGKCIGIMEQSAAFDKEEARLKYLADVEISTAKPEHLIRFCAKTIIPKRITDKMREAHFRKLRP